MSLKTAASNLKAKWMEMPDECFETRAFGDIAVAESFIGLPMPGDNDGHGGLKGRFILFTKTHNEITEAAPGLTYGIPTGRAVSSAGVSSDFPHSMPILLIIT